jgi:hypothetical protein
MDQGDRLDCLQHSSRHLAIVAFARSLPTDPSKGTVPPRDHNTSPAGRATHCNSPTTPRCSRSRSRPNQTPRTEPQMDRSSAPGTPAHRRQQAGPKGAAQMVGQDVGPRTRLFLSKDLALDLHVVGAGPIRGGNDDFESTDRIVNWQVDKKRRNNVCSTSVMISYRHPKQEARSRMIIGIIREETLGPSNGD